MTDVKTLRLASIQLTSDRLEAFMRYQQTLLAELDKSTGTDWSGKYAFAHAAGLTASKLDLVEMGKLKSLIGEFCGRRSAIAQVKERLDQAKTGSSPKDAQIVARAQKELPKLENLAHFEDRYGKQAVELLVAREADLLSLHRELAKREGGGEGGGHVHPVLTSEGH